MAEKKRGAGEKGEERGGHATKGGMDPFRTAGGENTGVLAFA